MFSSIITCSLLSMQSTLVHVETVLTPGLPQFNVVGLPDSIVRESKERVRSAFEACSLSLPLKRITVNLAPANIRKDCSAFDLPLAVSILASQGFLPSGTNSLLAQAMLIGELSLNGELQSVPGALCMAQCAREHGLRYLVLPADSAAEAAMIPDIHVIGLHSLPEAIDWLTGRLHVEPEPYRPFGDRKPDLSPLGMLMGQPSALRALSICAAGFHPLLLWGPPGTGKTTSAKALNSLIPAPDEGEYLEIASIYSAMNLPLPQGRPFRAPHHTITGPALVGGGIPITPGEITLAHYGVLFLDELPEFSGRALETFRQPLEDHRIRLSRLQQTVEFPARFLLVASMNPCPCGFYPQERCTCSPTQIQNYLRRIRGPLLDRIDLVLRLTPPRIDDLKEPDSETLEQLCRSVRDAQQKQRVRYEHAAFRFNSEIPGNQIRDYCRLDGAGEKVLNRAYERLHMSVRGYHRTLKTARTIADLEGSESITADHLHEALGFRAAGELENL